MLRGISSPILTRDHGHEACAGRGIDAPGVVVRVPCADAAGCGEVLEVVGAAARGRDVCGEETKDGEDGEGEPLRVA